MARIETYPLDGNISVNDYVIGTDGDSLNATKNYKVLTFLDYLGRLYNLNSTDLLFNYNAVDSVSVGNGEVSTNNFADGTILMSGVTNIYVSKLSAFGQLIDDIINTTGTENLSIMFTDMGNRNNLGIFTVNSTVDVNANTINMSVTGTTTVGSITSGKVMGIRIGVGGGNEVDLSNYVDLTTAQIINGSKTFNSKINANGGVDFNIGAGTISVGALSSTLLSFNSNATGVFDVILDFSLLTTADRTLSFPNKNGEIALTSDIPSLTNYVTTNTTQDITGVKTFTNTLVNEKSHIFKATSDIFTLGAINAFGLYANPLGQFALKDQTHGTTQSLAFDIAGLTSHRLYTFPDKNGTVAMTSDIPSLSQYVTTNTTQSISGAKTFTSYQFFNAGFNSSSPIVLSGTSNGIFMANANAGLNTATNNGIWFDSSDNFTFRSKGDTFSNTLASLVNTANRTHTLPDKSGTVAHTNDIPVISSGTATPSTTSTGGFTLNSILYTYSRVADVVTFSVTFNLDISITTGSTLEQITALALPFSARNSRTALAVYDTQGLDSSFTATGGAAGTSATLILTRNEATTYSATGREITISGSILI